MYDKKGILILSVDLEDVKHLEYFHKYGKMDRVSVIDNVYGFLKKLEKKGLKTTFFVLLDVVKENRPLVRDIIEGGHEIALHGFDHEPLYRKDKSVIRKELYEAKSFIEETFSVEIKGYRAPCFSVFDGIENILLELGFEYDSSYVNFSAHDLYGKYDISRWNKIKRNLYEKNGLFEFEIPHINLGNFKIPYGGGYFRMLPWFVQKYLFRNVFNDFKPLVVYLHPFELGYKKIGFQDKINIKDKLRFNIGRKSCNYKIDRLLALDDYRILNFSQYSEEIKGSK